MSSSSTSDVSMSHSTYPAPKPLKREDYPNINNWNCPRNAKAQCKCIIVTDTSKISADTVNSTALTNDNDDSDDKRGVPAFLVGTDGKLLSIEYKKQIYSSIEGFFNNNVDPKNVPINYSSSGETLHKNFHNFIEMKHKPLALCLGHWEANVLFIQQYHGWLRSYQRHMDKNDEIHVVETKKQKPQEDNIDDADGDEEDKEDSEDEDIPQPKKWKVIEKVQHTHYLFYTECCFHSQQSPSKQRVKQRYSLPFYILCSP